LQSSWILTDSQSLGRKIMASFRCEDEQQWQDLRWLTQINFRFTGTEENVLFERGANIRKMGLQLWLPGPPQ